MEKTVKIKVCNTIGEVELTEEQLRQALKEIEEQKEEKGWYNSLVGQTKRIKLEYPKDKEVCWPTKEMALAARRLCKEAWEYKEEFCESKNFDLKDILRQLYYFAKSNYADR